jgi:hypothetical protein
LRMDRKSILRLVLEADRNREAWSGSLRSIFGSLRSNDGGKKL